MTDICISADFWGGTMLPEGIFERWRVAEGTLVDEGDAVAEIRIEDALHELPAPSRGRLTQFAKVNQVVEPGSVIGRVG
jgi:pyruvate/2-oxoglutarate dehydrogenase complex dihydrolipoamide acyltransferase (E2) component